MVESMPVNNMNGEIQFMDFQVRTIIIWLDAEWREEFNSSGIIFIARNMWSSLTRVVQPTELE